MFLIYKWEIWSGATRGTFRGSPKYWDSFNWDQNKLQSTTIYLSIFKILKGIDISKSIQQLTYLILALCSGGKMTNINMSRPCCLQSKNWGKTSTTNLTSRRTYSGVTCREDGTLYDAALFLGPWLSVRVGCAGAGDPLSIGAGWQVLPAVPKHQWVDHHSMAPCGEVIICIAVVVATQPTHTTLK